MIPLDAEGLANLAAIIWLDIVLSGDNALVIGMAAASLAPHLQRRAILFGMALAVIIRIAAALVATTLYQIPWIRVIGAIALLWVAWKLYVELRRAAKHRRETADEIAAEQADASDRRSILRALTTIAVADISMSIDNVLAVAGIAHDNPPLLVFGLALSIMLMAFFATVICRVLNRYPWISYVGVALLVVVAGEMLHSSSDAILGWIEWIRGI